MHRSLPSKPQRHWVNRTIDDVMNTYRNQLRITYDSSSQWVCGLGMMRVGLRLSSRLSKDFGSMRYIIRFVLRALLTCLCLLGGCASAADLPNILFLLSDDHSYPFLSCYGDSNVKTPVIDQLAADGMKFHRFFTAAPQCVPSRASLMTGRSPVAARITRFSSPLARDEITFPELLREKAGTSPASAGARFISMGREASGLRRSPRCSRNTTCAPLPSAWTF